MNNKEKRAAFWKKVREELKEKYGITAKTPVGDKKGYQMMNWLVTVAIRFNELDMPKRMTLKCPECGQGFHDTEGGKKGLKRHFEVRHPDKTLSLNQKTYELNHSNKNCNRQA